jgi:hypothetical protein
LILSLIDDDSVIRCFGRFKVFVDETLTPGPRFGGGLNEKVLFNFDVVQELFLKHLFAELYFNFGEFTTLVYILVLKDVDLFFALITGTQTLIGGIELILNFRNMLF